MKIFVAGATGAVGRRLVPLLVEAGHEVFGTTRSEAKKKDLLGAGAQPVVVDVFDAAHSHAQSSQLARRSSCTSSPIYR
jgi:uncharacterized protein YbjT (DUF2867 family)